MLFCSSHFAGKVKHNAIYYEYPLPGGRASLPIGRFLRMIFNTCAHPCLTGLAPVKIHRRRSRQAWNLWAKFLTDYHRFSLITGSSCFIF